MVNKWKLNELRGRVFPNLRYDIFQYFASGIHIYRFHSEAYLFTQTISVSNSWWISQVWSIILAQQLNRNLLLPATLVVKTVAFKKHVSLPNAVVIAKIVNTRKAQRRFMKRQFYLFSGSSSTHKQHKHSREMGRKTLQMAHN